MNQLFPVIIVDDIKAHQENLKKKIELYCGSLKVEATCSNLPEAVEAIRRFDPVIVFLDIDLGNQTGFNLLKELDEYKFHVIFVSAHNSTENLMRAIKISAAGFVTKPIDKDELILSVQKVLTGLDNESQRSNIKTLMHNLSSSLPSSQLILVSNKSEGERQLRIGDIVFCESENTKVHFRLADKRSFTVTASLSSYEDMLAPFGFYRIQRSYLININYVDRVLRHQKDIIMQHYPDIEMSASRDKDLWDRFLHAWENKALKPG